MKTLVRLAASLLVISIILLSCASVKPDVADVSQEDSRAIIYYRDGVEPGDSGPYVSRTIFDSIPVPLLSPKNSIYFDLSTKTNIRPSISPDALYLSYRDNNNDTYARYSHKQSFSIYDIKNDAVVINSTTTVSCATSIQAPYSVPWSFIGHNFYTLAGDTIKKCTVDGKQSTLTVIDNLINFSISPTEHWLLFVQEERVGFINLETNEVVLVKEFDNILGTIAPPCVRVIAWSLDDTKVAFGDGHRITTVVLEKKEIIGHKVTADVYDIEWVSDDMYVYVEGYNQNSTSLYNSEPFFEIASYSLTTKKDNMLHRRVSHEPVSIKPKVSPSGKLLLFSEKKVAGTYEVMLLSLDGSNMTTLCTGYNPVWGR